jgi:hypothetical protein
LFVCLFFFFSLEKGFLAPKLARVEDQCKVMIALAEELPRTLVTKRALAGIEICRCMLTLLTVEDASKLILTATSLSSILDFLSGLVARLGKLEQPQRLCVLFDLLASLVQREALDESVALRLVESCLVPVFNAIPACASFAAKVVKAVFEQYELQQSAILETCINRQWPLDSKPTFRLLPPCKGAISEASALVLDLLFSPEVCASVVAVLFGSQELRPVFGLLLNDAIACMGVQPHSCNLLLAAATRLASHATHDVWALEMIGSIVAAVAVAGVAVVPANNCCGVCSVKVELPSFFLSCSRCKVLYHGACVSIVDENVLTLSVPANNDDENSACVTPHEFWVCRACVVKQHPISNTVLALVNVMLSALKEKSSKIRVRAVRGLAAVMQVHPKLLSDRPDVAAAVRSRFFDQNTSVREAVVDLAGQLGKLYFSEIVDRARDTGLAVRKRAVRVLAAIAAQEHCSPEREQALVALAGRLDDEKSVKLLARQAFEKV